ncbi:hypothetical protein EIP86_006195 [Pleurotus ostreatoroseus]|nr:hypothetical protein EIP86_006195 [Pleurotus ostreatoroseus]
MDEVILTQEFLKSPEFQECIRSAVDTPPTLDFLEKLWSLTQEELMDNTPKIPYFVLPGTHELKIKRRPPHSNQPVAYLYNGHDVTQYFIGPLSAHLSWDVETRSWRFPQYLENNRGPENDESLPDIKDSLTLYLEARFPSLAQPLDEIDTDSIMGDSSTPLILRDTDSERIMSPPDWSVVLKETSTMLSLLDGNPSCPEVPQTPVMSRKSICASGFDTPCGYFPMQVSPAKKLQYDGGLLQGEEHPGAPAQNSMQKSKDASTESLAHPLEFRDYLRNQ